MAKQFKYCPNPKCTVGEKEMTRPTIITPANALYKPEGGSNVVIAAPKKFRKKWGGNFKYKDKITKKKYKMDKNVVYCPVCNERISLKKEPFRIVIIGPTACGKTVYLTVLHEIMANRRAQLPMYFSRVGGDGAFTFERDGNKYFLPNATANSAFDYMIYDCEKGVGDDDFYNLKKKGVSRKQRDKENVELIFYDLSGEFFQEGDLTRAEDRYVKLAQLDHADLVLIVIDCKTIVGESNERSQEFSKFLDEQLRGLKKRNQKNFSAAICYLAADELDSDVYREIKDEIRNPMYNTHGFFRKECDKHIADVYKAFGREKGVVKRLIGDGLFVQGETLGLFAVSSVGDQPIVDTGEGEYVLDFKSEQSWNVMAPIFWFLNRKGYVDTVESKN